MNTTLGGKTEVLWVKVRFDQPGTWRADTPDGTHPRAVIPPNRDKALPSFKDVADPSKRQYFGAPLLAHCKVALRPAEAQIVRDAKMEVLEKDIPEFDKVMTAVSDKFADHPFLDDYFGDVGSLTSASQARRQTYLDVLANLGHYGLPAEKRLAYAEALDIADISVVQ